MENNELKSEMADVDQLEPVVLASVSEVTGAAPGGNDDADNVVWGNI